MLVFLNVRKYLLISILTIVLDGIITYYIPSYLNRINYFYPMLTISFIPFIYLANKRKFYLLIVIIGIIYDLLYSSIFFYNLILFIILINLDKRIAKYFKNSLLLLIILVLLNIIVYDIIGFSLVTLTSYELVTINDLIYKISHSIILNIMSVFVFWFLLKKDISHA